MRQDPDAEPGEAWEFLEANLTRLDIDITTGELGKSGNAGTDDPVYFSMKYKGENELPKVKLNSGANDWEAGKMIRYPIPGFKPTAKKPEDIEWIKLQKDGGDGWLLKGAVLYANGDYSHPVICNNNINQFVDNKPAGHGHDWWSSNRIIGPVLGYISANTANIQYRVEREGVYYLQVYDSANNSLVGGPISKSLDSSTGTACVFNVAGLAAGKQYSFKLNFGKAPSATEFISQGNFITAPAEGSGVKFSFAFGSCSRNSYAPDQIVWKSVQDTAANSDLKFFLHTGDIHYFYDDVCDEQDMAKVEKEELRSIARAAQLSMRLNTNFRAMAKTVPTCAIWDDHDFRKNNGDVGDGLFVHKETALTSLLEYWANPEPLSENNDYGLTSRVSYGNVDIYLLDGRYCRDKKRGLCFIKGLRDVVINDIKNREPKRLRILVSGSTWNHIPDGAGYGDPAYEVEREDFYRTLNDLIVDKKIEGGLIFISGDIHTNEIYEVNLPGGKVAPEFVCSPLGPNSVLKAARAVSGEDGKTERKVSIETHSADAGHELGDWPCNYVMHKSRYAFATLEIDTTNSVVITVNYRNVSDYNKIIYSKSYTLTDGQFKYTGKGEQKKI